MAAAMMNVSVSDHKHVIKTNYGLINKKGLINSSNDALYKPKTFDVDLETLFGVYDVLDKEESEDEVYDHFSNRVLFPARIQILKTLYFYLEEEEKKSLLTNQFHKALFLAREAHRLNKVHKVRDVRYPEPVVCVCDREHRSRNALVCECCKTVLCYSCARAPCAVLLKEVIMEEERMDDDLKNFFSGSSTDADDEASEEGEDDDDMKMDDEDEDENEEMDTAYDSDECDDSVEEYIVVD